MNQNLIFGKTFCSHECFENNGSGKLGNISTNVNTSEEVFYKTIVLFWKRNIQKHVTRFSPQKKRSGFAFKCSSLLGLLSVQQH